MRERGTRVRTRIVVGMFAAAALTAVFVIWRHSCLPETKPTNWQEIEALIPDDIRYQAPKMSPSENLWERLVAISRRIDGQSRGIASMSLHQWFSRPDSDLPVVLHPFVQKHRPIIAALRDALSLPSGVVTESKVQDGFSNIHDLLDATALVDCSDGSKQACELALEDLVRLTRAVLRIRGFPGGGPDTRSWHAVLAHAAKKGRLTPEFLRELQNALPTRGEIASSQAEYVKRRFHETHLPLVTNREVAEAYLKRDTDISFKDVGNWDPIENVRVLSALTREKLSNVGRPYCKFDRTVETMARSWVSRTPMYDLTADEGLEASVQRARWRSKMNRARNSLGRLLLGRLSGSSGLQGSTALELKRVTLGLMAYELESGRLPNELRGSAGKGAVPYDPYSGEALCYDRARRLIWSVGENCVNDGGSDGRDVAAYIPETRATARRKH